MVMVMPSSMGQWGCLAGALAHGELGALERRQAQARDQLPGGEEHMDLLIDMFDRPEENGR